MVKLKAIWWGIYDEKDRLIGYIHKEGKSVILMDLEGKITEASKKKPEFLTEILNQIS